MQILLLREEVLNIKLAKRHCLILGTAGSSKRLHNTFLSTTSINKIINDTNQENIGKNI